LEEGDRTGQPGLVPALGKSLAAGIYGGLSSRSHFRDCARGS
jgi:hypothetical protein